MYALQLSKYGMIQTRIVRKLCILIVGQDRFLKYFV